MARGRRQRAGRPPVPLGAAGARATDAAPEDAVPHRGRVERRRSDVVALVACAVVLTVGGVVADRGVSAGEAGVLHALNHLPAVLDLPLYAVQLLGTVVVPVVVAAGAAAYRRFRLASGLLLVLPLKWLVEVAAKAVVDRMRPAASGVEVVLRHGSPAEGLSYPSGHALVAFAVAGLLLPHVGRRTAVLLLGLAAAVAVARVYLGAHSPLDVVGGAAAGLLVAALVGLVVGRPVRG